MKVGARVRNVLSRGFPVLHPRLIHTFFPGPICLPVEIPLAYAKHRALSEGGNEWAIFGI